MMAQCGLNAIVMEGQPVVIYINVQRLYFPYQVFRLNPFFYRYYLRVTQLLESITFQKHFTLGFELYRFAAPNTWTNEGAFTAKMVWQFLAPPGYPTTGDYLVGDVKNNAGTVVGRLTMGWVSPSLRKATLEIDRVSVSEVPLNNGAGIDWKAIFNPMGWDVAIAVSDADVVEPSGESWSDAELHQAMLARRDASNLDSEWRYHILAVQRIDSTPRGIMYDAGATDSNNVPREGAALSSHWVIPNEDPWGLVKGVRFGAAAAPYFRTAVHELGHALGLFHNTVDNGIMNTTDVIASSGTAANPFPNNIQWFFATDDQKRLRHYPDIYIRPGGTAFGTASEVTPPISPTDMVFTMEGLELRVTPLLTTVPLGAAVRMNVELINTSDRPIMAPINLSMKSGMVRGIVTDPNGTSRTFLPLVRCIEEHPIGNLEPGQRIMHSITLLRGAEGALFPLSGAYRVCVDVNWEMGGMTATVAGEATLMVTAAVDEAHGEAALKVLSTPDALLTLVLGGDHLPEGIEAIQTALENPILRPHFAFIEAKRLADRFGQRKPDLKAAAELIDDATVMSPAEIQRAAMFLKAGSTRGLAANGLAAILKAKVSQGNVSADVKKIVDAL
jgi:hypothetical protein